VSFITHNKNCRNGPRGFVVDFWNELSMEVFESNDHNRINKSESDWILRFLN